MADSDLGTRIKRARERMRWSQQRLADELGVGVRSVGSWERGETVPRNAIGALEEVLGVDLTGDAQPEAYTDPDEARIWGWTEFTPGERRAMIAALRAERRATA